MKKYIIILISIILIISFNICKNKGEKMNKIKITINDITYTATLENNETAKNLIQKLPLDITMNELNNNEKYYYFDTTLPNNPINIDKINTGDIMLYGDNCIVIFYQSFNTTYTYTKIGTIDNPSSLKENIGNQNVKVSITKLEN